jgi:hypothetical protein
MLKFACARRLSERLWASGSKAYKAVHINKLTLHSFLDLQDFWVDFDTASTILVLRNNGGKIGFCRAIAFASAALPKHYSQYTTPMNRCLGDSIIIVCQYYFRSFLHGPVLNSLQGVCVDNLQGRVPIYLCWIAIKRCLCGRLSGDSASSGEDAPRHQWLIGGT